MARNRTPQTQEKRRRERDKQMKRQEKIARRRERSAAKREAKREAGIRGPEPPAGPENPPAEGRDDAGGSATPRTEESRS